MRYLIDTHTFLWYVGGSDELSKTAKALIDEENNEIFISMASLWEISIKTSLGKLSISGSYESVINDVNENGIEVLPINFTHTVIQNKLPFHHRDPFDRIIISQAILEKMDIIGCDEIFDNYLSTTEIKRIW